MAGNIGIDLGTTHSLVAAVMSGKARSMLDDDGRALLPSAVRYTADGALDAVGWDALRKVGDPDGTTFTSVKRFMGRGPADVQQEAALFRYPLADDDRVVRFQVSEDKQVTPVEISAEVLRALAARAEELLLGKPGGAVITVPAYFDDAQRQATRDAARIAGLDVLRLINEPTAAALAYGLEKQQDGAKVAVYDLGGGTFDISILELTEGVFQVLSTAGDTHLGGDDFDQALAQVLLNQAGLPDPDGLNFRRAVRAAEAAKRALSDRDETTLSVDLGGQTVEATIDRASFEALIRPIVARTAAACQRALSDAGLQPSDIDEVVMVGGSTRVPLVRQYVGELFGQQPHVDIDPDQVVALGAAMQADILSGQSDLADELLLLDVIPLSLGLEVMGGVSERLIPRCSTIPANASQTFTTHVDGQNAVEIHVVQGERELIGDNRSLARFRLSGLPALPAGVPRIKVDFTVDADGILHVSATEEFTGRKAAIDVQPSYGLDEDEIEQMLEDAIDNAETDVDQRLLIEARVEAEQVLRALDQALRDDAEMLAPDESEQINAVATALRESLETTERKRISDLTHKLDEVSAPFAQRRIERDLTLALSGRDAEDVAGQLGMPS
ncbi:MAG: Fe-S protein assembly chaperone HscA [Myxococcota bacterium]